MVSTLEQENRLVNYKPQKFVIWLFVVSSTIMFGGFTSYYLVFVASKGKGHGLLLPDAFLYSTIILVASSATLFLAALALKRNQKSLQRILLWITLGLGVGFGFLQFEAWTSLYQSGAFLVNNNAAISLIYIVSGFHLIHILAGLFMVLFNLIGSYTNISPEKATFRQEITSIFWHFLDILWIYLYVFLLLNS